MKEITCSGSPHEIGFAHGDAAKEEIARAIEFYASLFKQKSGLEWAEVKALSRDFNDNIQAKWPRYHEELQGVARGANRDLLDIMALNVRSEIVFGQFSDGCTSLYCRSQEYTYMGQNWDWMEEQAPNLIQLTIVQDNLPTIKIVTEAGIIGKIGLNSAGVAVCFNAIRAHGITKSSLPCHLGLRLALESTSAEEAAASLEKIGMASSGHFLIGDAKTAIGLEFTSKTFARVPVNDRGFLVHSNHLLQHHPDTYEPKWLDDSPVRIDTMSNRVLKTTSMTKESFASLFEDETGYPFAINRAAEGDGIATLFNIVFDLRSKTAVVREGRLVKGGNTKIQLHFDAIAQ